MTRPTILRNPLARGGRQKLVALAVTTAIASATLGSYATQAAPRAEVSASKAQKALAKGKTEKAILYAEAAVEAEPRNSTYRAMLGATYMEIGRFQSAATSFDDAMSLGDNSPRTVLSLALAQIAMGDNPSALALLNDWRSQIAPDDMGLALALAGQADQGVEILTNALRAGPSTPKLRQNLAYAYALQGNWRSARIMAAEDVPANRLDERISEWARSGKPEDYQKRVASLLQVPVVDDSGQPTALALNNHSNAQQLAAEAAATVPAPAVAQAAPVVVAPRSTGELAPVGSNYAYAAASNRPLPPLAGVPAPVAATPPVQTSVAVAPRPARPESFQDAFSAPAPTGASFAQVAESAVRFVSNPVVQRAPVLYGAEVEPRREVRTARRTVVPRVSGQAQSSRPAASPGSAASSNSPIASAPNTNGSHLVQLGSFSSEQGARRAWGIYAKRYPQLSAYDMVITEARVRGKKYYRVSAGGFQRADARSMCSMVKGRGQGCFAWAEGRPMPGALDTGVRMARR